MGGAIDYPESPLGVPCGGEVKLNKLAVSNNIVLIIVTVILSISGKDVHIVDMYAVPTWKSKTVDPMAALPVSYLFLSLPSVLLDSEIQYCKFTSLKY